MAEVREALRLLVDGTEAVWGAVDDVQLALLPPVIGDLFAISHTLRRGITRGVGKGIDLAAGGVDRLSGLLGDLRPEKRGAGVAVDGNVNRVNKTVDAVVAALNGVMGDQLLLSDSPLAIPMAFHPPVEGADLGARGATLLVMVHGSSTNDAGWSRTIVVDGENQSHDHGRALLTTLEREVTLTYLRYNSGRHIRHNGDDFSRLLESAADGFDHVILVGHSMGGLVIRSAVDAAERTGASWRSRLETIITIATPHHGAPLERFGHQVETVLGLTSVTAPIGKLARIRSAGITDLREGSVVDVVDDDGDRFSQAPRPHTHVPLPHGVRCFAIAGTRTPRAEVSAEVGAEVGAHVRADVDEAKVPGVIVGLTDDGLVPVASALGRHQDPSRSLRFDGTVVVTDTHHQALLGDPAVLAALVQWCAADPQALD